MRSTSRPSGDVHPWKRTRVRIGAGLPGLGRETIGLTLIPDAGFWEFMPVPEYHLWRADPTYKPALVRLDAVQPGEYVLTVTSLGGGPFVRYVIGDLIRVIALEDKSSGHCPAADQGRSRADSTINLGSMVVLTERAIWNALTLLDLGLTKWTRRV